MKSVLITLAVCSLMALPAACASDSSGGEDGDDDNGGGGGGGGGGEGDGDGDGDGGGSVTAFRFSQIAFRDPHLFIDALGCQDITDQINSSFETSIQEDNGTPPDVQEPDGLLDLSALLVFRPLDSAGEGGAVDLLLGADCTATDPTACTPGQAEVGALAAENSARALCDLVLPDSVDDEFSPAIRPAQAPCFATDPGSDELNLTPLVVSDYTLAGTYQEQSGVVDGTLRAWMSETVAEATVVTTPVGDRTVASLLPGGEGSCAAVDARDVGPDGDSGWYVYLQFAAESVDYSE